MRSTAEVNAVTATAISQLGGLAILVKNAVIEVAGLLLEISESDFDVNVLGVWRCTGAADRRAVTSTG
ncbi:hypothetical protein [Paraburkholderia sp. GAS334]|uniref:hypothetical protein n=1 Tax=Paraburkholderia sp. GAS334 TaxID=3035131 RepID=UPI003D1DD15E